MEQVYEWIKILGGSSVLIAISAFIAKLLVEVSFEKTLAKFKSDFEAEIRKREKSVEKLEELHNALMEMYLRLYIKHLNIIEMVKQGATVEHVREYTGYQNMGQEAFVLQSRIKSLTSIYASEIDTDISDKIDELVKQITLFSSKHIKNTLNRSDYDALNDKLEGFRVSANKYMDRVCALIKETSNK
ncbi:hypothetical protein SIO17_20595 [Pseudoalteromonas piscicida]|uniref:Uncharacterized protein n=1 Tax=Pseudoalteromonas piscicida TaxID=43662 RepID=A0ABN5CJ21_PSEO7|nr:hypothetical protein [Pseudoalteromonas piscicida]ATD09495.1 hypothetical protein PPIS_b0308 [Pseudoalteromonas piscicida]WPU31422.1 hypothetical protein SIO17_20595 [Pseudoalteromonas piscicida]